MWGAAVRAAAMPASSSHSTHTAALRQPLGLGRLPCTSPGITALPTRQFRPRRHRESRVPWATAAGGDESSADMGDAAYEDYELNYQAWLEKTRIASEEGYLALKDALFKRTQRGGTFLTLYVFLVVSSPAALCTMIGAGASYLYLQLLIWDVDGRDIEDDNLVMDADEIESPVVRALTKALGAYRQALRLRLLVPVALAAGAWWFNQTSDTPLGLTEEGCLFLGFASYKLALVIEVWESLKPRAKTREELDKMERPMLPELEDVDDIRPDLKDEKF